MPGWTQRLWNWLRSSGGSTRVDLDAFTDDWRGLSDRMVESLAASEQRFRATVESAPMAMVMINASGTIVLVNAETEKLFGHSRDEMMGQPIEMLVPERFREGHPELRGGFFANPESRRMGSGRDLFGLRKDGREFPVEIGLNPVETDEKQFVLSAVVDITERKRAQDELARYASELERSNKELDDFAYIASHDLRSPLQGVRKIAGWIQEDNAQLLPEKSQRHLEQMQQRIRRLESLLDDLLQYSRAGRLHGDVVQTDTAHMTRGIISLLPSPEGISVSIAGEMPTLVTARTPLEQVLRNLINNAIKHHDRDDGRVQISCCENGEFLEFAVADDGPGIAEEYHQRIFKMFETLKPRDEVEGSGMGLSVVKKIVESYGGRITVESSAGGGATFRFTWPRTVTLT